MFARRKHRSLAAGVAALLVASGGAWASAGSVDAATRSSASVEAASPANSEISDVSFQGGKPAWAVGTIDQDSTRARTFAERWRGSTWEQVPSQTPNNNGYALLRSVSGDWAVGYYQELQSSGQSLRSLIEHWTGTEWKQVPSPDPGDGHWAEPLSVSGNLAVGYYLNASNVEVPMSFHWTGTKWAHISIPYPREAGQRGQAASFDDVSGDWAAGEHSWQGDHSKTLVDHWNGHRWTTVPSANVSYPNIGYTDGLSAVSGDWAVGGSPPDHPLIEHWNGTSWTGSVIDVYGSLWSVSAEWAAGSNDGDVILFHRQASSWKQVTPPTYDGSPVQIQAVTRNWIGGYYTVKTSTSSTDYAIIEHWNGHAWVRT